MLPNFFKQLTKEIYEVKIHAQFWSFSQKLRKKIYINAPFVYFILKFNQLTSISILLEGIFNDFVITRSPKFSFHGLINYLILIYLFCLLPFTWTMELWFLWFFVVCFIYCPDFFHPFLLPKLCLPHCISEWLLYKYKNTNFRINWF